MKVSPSATVFLTVMPVGLTGNRRVSGPFAPARAALPARSENLPVSTAVTD
jgi:hypothetical protein